VKTTECTRCETPAEVGDLRCAICGEPTPATVGEADLVETILLRCTGCSAALSHDPDHEGHACGFCGEPLELEKSTDPLEVVEKTLPFTVDAAAAQAALQAWLGDQGFFQPTDLKKTARLDSLRPLWWVAWCFDADALMSWAADSEVGSNQSQWAPHSGQVEMRFEDVLVSASRGLTGVETDALEESYDLSSGVAEPEVLDGALREEFDVQRSAARARVQAALRRIGAARLEREEVPGSSCRNLHFEPLLRSLETRRLAFPAWVLAYRYRDELYRVVISGQDAKYVRGKAPFSFAKLLLVVGLVIGALLLLALFALALSIG
jgi:hypothetical protein